MATSEATLQSVPQEQGSRSEWRTGALSSLVLTAVALPIHGYHPYVEDGGVYLTGVKYLLYPHLYPYWTGFATAHLRYEFFAPMLAALVRATGLGLARVTMIVYIAGIWATLFAGWLLIARCTANSAARYGAVALLALTLTIPVAGTSLILMDPYVTARSIATPCALFALVATLAAIEKARSASSQAWRSIALCCVTLGLAMLAHPLMAAYAIGCVLMLLAAAPQNRRTRWIALGSVSAISFMAAAVLASLSPKMSAAYLQTALTRNYWFLSTWHWYEQFGLIAPLVVLFVLSRKTQGGEGSPARMLARMAIAAGVTAIAVALAFAGVSQAGSLVARVQPLRIYQTIYVLMLLGLGALLGERVLRRSLWRWAVLFCALGPIFYFVQVETFPHSGHIELPGREPANPWEQGFLWIRNHTPKDARFALDAKYITAPQEDSQNFRAAAERSALPDYAKDGGIASIAPDLTATWEKGEALQKDLDRGLGAAQIARLRRAGVDWVVLSRDTPSAVPCEYSNTAMKVCALPQSGL